MARPKGDGVNKSELVREILRENPKTKVGDVVNMLAEKGHKILPSQVYFIKSKLRDKRQRKIRQNVARTTGNSDPIYLIRKVKVLAAEVGGIKNLKQLVEVMSE